MSFRRHALGVVLACLFVATTVLGDEDGGKGKGKGKGAAPAQSPTVIQLDVSKLSPDLVKALLKYASQPGKAEDGPKDKGPGKGKGAAVAKAAEPPSKGKAPAKGKAAEPPSKGKTAAKPAAKGKPAAPTAKGYMGGKQLPPGLANKPANHPGRTHYIQHVLGGKDPTKKGAPGKFPGKGKKNQEEEDE